MKKSKLFLILLIVAMLAFVVMLLVLMNMGIIPTSSKNKTNSNAGESKPSSLGKIDDWCYDPAESSYDSYGITSMKSGAINSMATFDAATAGAVSSESTIGYSVGGAKDINNFRENIEEGYFPLETDITYEGIYYDYSFDTGNTDVADSSKMFYPTYSTAISKDPISGNEEYFVSVGLNSNIKESDFSRKKLNVVLVLDISGSMSSSIDDYYYDFNENDKEYKTKMKLAEESINVLLDQLNPDDSVSVVLFDNSGYLAKPLNKVGETDIEEIKKHILEVEAMGGTNFEAGYNLANEQFEKNGIGDTNEYENRIIVITDAMPNVGETSKEGLRKLMEENSEQGVYTSFIGVGLDFNTEVVKNITDVRGANYYSVSSEEEFKSRMGDEFEFMVTPLVFDLNMDLESDDFEIEKIYGTDSIDSEEGNILHVNTLFPSKTNDDGEVRGGIILLKLKKTKDDAKDLTLKVSYETRDGQKDSAEELVEFSSSDEYYDNTGIRKGILLARYVNLIKNWAKYERTSVKLEPVSNDYRAIFRTFLYYLDNEIEEIGDKDLKQESDFINFLLDY